MKNLIKNVYIHLPFCLKKCHFCAFPIHAIGEDSMRNKHTEEMIDLYIKNLKLEINQHLLSDHMKVNQNNKSHILYGAELQTLYFGGGTPSLFGPTRVSEIIQTIKKVSNFNKQIPEITLQLNLEQIDMIPSFTESGINRYSIGIQSFNKNQLKMFNRNYKSSQYNNNSKKSTGETRQIAKQFMHQTISKFQTLLKDNHLSNFNVDFILDLNPQKQDQEIFLQFIDKIKPPHLSIYLLEVLENTYLQKRLKLLQTINITNTTQSIQVNQFHNLKQKFNSIHENYIRVSKRLVEQFQYNHYEVSNFALKKDSIKQNPFQQKQQSSNQYNYWYSNHNQIYWQGNKQFVSYGMGASALLQRKHLNRAYEQYINQYMKNKQIRVNDLLRITNPRTLKKYYEYVQVIRKRQLNNQQNKYEQMIQKSLLQIHIEHYPVSILQSYIFSSIRTYKGILYRKLKQIIITGATQIDSQSLRMDSVKHKETEQNQQVKYIQLVSRIQKLLEEQVSGDNQIINYKFTGSGSPYYQYLKEQIHNQNIHNHVNKQQVIGFRLKSPYGYLIADQIGNKIAVLVEQVFK